MRLPGRTLGTCSSCDGELVRGAAWCGGCGARVAAPDHGPAESDVLEIATESTVAGADAGRGARWGVVAAVVAVLASVLVAHAGRTPPPEAILGRAGNGANVTSTGLPPQDLHLAWAHELPLHDHWLDVNMLAHDGLVRIGDRIVDLELGTVVRTSDRTRGGDEALVPRVSGRDLVVVDQIRATVVERIPLPDVALEGHMWPSMRHGDVTFYSGDEGSAIVRDDGTVLADLPGWVEDWNRWDEHGAMAVPVRSGLDLHMGPTGDLRLVSLLDGSVLLEREVGTDDALLSGLRDDRVLLTTQAMLVEGTGGAPPPWGVELVDARTGDVLFAGDIVSWGPPRLVGRTDDGGSLLALGSDDDVDLVEITGAGDVVRRATLERRKWDVFDDGRGLLPSAGLTDDGLLVELLPTNEVEARTLEGDVVWRVPAAETGSLAVDGDVVALLPRVEHGRAPVGALVIDLLDAGDGALLASVDVAPALDPLHWGARPVALVAGVLGVGLTSGWTHGPASLAEMRWMDVATGEVRTRKKVFEAWTDDGVNVGGDLRLAGMVTDATMGLRPVVIEAGPDGLSLQVLQGGALVRHTLPPHEARRSDTWLEVVGATSSTVAVWSESWQDEQATVTSALLEFETGEVLDIDGVAGLLLVEDLFVGLEREEPHWNADAVLVGHDPVTGERRWTGPAMPQHQRDVLHDDASLLVGDELERTLVSLDDGEVAWTLRSDELLRTGGVLGPRHVLLTTRGGEVVALDRETGEEVWRRDVGAPITSMTGAGDGAVVGTLAGEVVVLDGGGEPVQRLDLGEVPFHAAALGDTLVVQFPDRVEGFRPDGTGFTVEDEVELP